MMMGKHTVYRVDCIVTDHVYIGITKQKLKYRLRQHLDLKYKGNDNLKYLSLKYCGNFFTIKALKEFDNRDDAARYECQVISDYMIKYGFRCLNRYMGENYWKYESEKFQNWLSSDEFKEWDEYYGRGVREFLKESNDYYNKK